MTMKLLYLAIALMYLVSNLTTSTHAAKEDKEDDKDKGKGKGKCPGIPQRLCPTFETKCCKTDDCGTGEICCHGNCKFQCMKQKDIKGSLRTPEINLSKEKCKEYNKTESFVTTNPSVTKN